MKYSMGIGRLNLRKLLIKRKIVDSLYTVKYQQPKKMKNKKSRKKKLSSFLSLSQIHTHGGES